MPGKFGIIDRLSACGQVQAIIGLKVEVYKCIMVMVFALTSL